MEEIRVSVVQFEPKPFREKEENAEFHIENIKKLGDDNDLIIFPELSLTNFFETGPNARLNYWEEAEPLDGKYVKMIMEAAKQKDVHVIFGMAEKTDRDVYLYNSAILLAPEGIKGVFHKMHLPRHEKFFFMPGGEPEVFDTRLGKIGISICYDMFFPETSRVLALKGAEIIVNIGSVWKGGSKGGIGSGSTELGESKERFFDLMPVMQALHNQVFFISANCSGKWNGGEEVGVCPFSSSFSCFFKEIL
jgi:predicted amidohydrolase